VRQMKQIPEIRFFPIPKNLKEMTPDERRDYATKLADHMLQQAIEENEKTNKPLIRKVLKMVVRIISIMLVCFFYLVAILQIQDHFVGYGIVSIGVGTIFLAFCLRARIRKWLQHVGKMVKLRPNP